MTRLTRLAIAATAVALWLTGARHDAPFWVTLVTALAVMRLIPIFMPTPDDERVAS